jgi:hypothetical protein
MIAGLALLALTLSGWLVLSQAEDKPKYTVKEVMVKAHKDPLFKTVTGGQATKEQKELLVEYYTALTLNKPTKGTAKSWKDKTDALLKDAKAVAGGDANATKALAKSGNCKACHDAHKGG